MDNQPQNPTVQINQTPPKKSSRLALAMIVEVVIFFIIFFGFLVVLNYFNILRVDVAFPFLSFLPHLPRTAQQIATQHAPNTSRTIPTSEPFNYDTGKSIGLLKQYLGETLLQNVLPPGSTEPGKGPATNVVSLTWNASTPTTFAGVGTMELSIGTNNVKRFTIIISPATIPSQDTLTQDMMTPLFNTYFQPLPTLSDWKCTSLHPKVSLCEQFKDKGDTKEGYGVALNKEITTANPQPTFFLFTCKYFKDDPNYAAQTSCIHLQ